MKVGWPKHFAKIKIKKYILLCLKPESILLPFKVNMVNSDIYLVFHLMNLSSQCLRSPTVNGKQWVWVWVWKTDIYRRKQNYLKKFYDYGSVHRWSILIIIQRDATQSSLFIILQVPSTCFGCQPHSSSGVHKTVTTASGTGHIFCAVTSLQRGHIGER